MPLTVHMVSSLDGFVAAKDGDTSWLRSTDNFEGGVELTEAQIQAYLDKIDSYIMGSRTYETALQLGWPYGKKPVTVLTSRSLPSNRPTVSFFNGEISDLVEQLRGKQTWLVGGPETTKQFFRQRLVDELIVSIIPVLLGDGLLFYDYLGEKFPLNLKEVTTYKDGTVELSYKVAQ